LGPGPHPARDADGPRRAGALLPRPALGGYGRHAAYRTCPSRSRARATRRQAEVGRSLESLDAPVQDEGDSAYIAGELIRYVDREFERVELRATIQRLANILEGGAREILRLRFEEDMLQSPSSRAQA
jgi:hypothetical protein